jgi:hypothetical protein
MRFWYVQIATSAHRSQIAQQVARIDPALVRFGAASAEGEAKPDAGSITR